MSTWSGVTPTNPYKIISSWCAISRLNSPTDCEGSSYHCTITMFDTPAQWPEWSTLSCVVVCVCLLSIFALFTRRYTKSLHINETASPSPYPPIEPLPDFDWKTKEPIKLRPFKPKYNLTMSTTANNTEKQPQLTGSRHPRRNHQRAHRDRQELPQPHQPPQEDHRGIPRYSPRSCRLCQASPGRILHLAGRDVPPNAVSEHVPVTSRD